VGIVSTKACRGVPDKDSMTVKNDFDRKAKRHSSEQGNRVGYIRDSPGLGPAQFSTAL